MRFNSFTINNYRAITGPLTIDVNKHSMVPIIGINESGKTTVLQAISAFDFNNDDLNDGRHIKDTVNLYKSVAPNATVMATFDITANELRRFMGLCEKQTAIAPQKLQFGTLRRRKKLPTQLKLKRDIVTKKYYFLGESFGDAQIHDTLGQKIVQYLPYILYFDDFRDKVDERIEVPSDPKSALTDWQEIVERLFKETDPAYSIFKLPKLEVRQRKSVLSKVQRKLNDTLTREWQSFRLDDRDALMISIEFAPATAEDSRNYIKLEVIETDDQGDQHFFFISDRSKGFYWFFNFVMKLEFNSKFIAEGDKHSVYLLDEPGSYLHALAQRKLCLKLKHLSRHNVVVYCTHSHYLLDPEVVPITSILIAGRDGSGNITTTRMIDYRGNADETRSALQPVMDALQVKPYVLDLLTPQKTILVEGICDYFALEMFRNKRSFTILPSVGADSIKFYISLMLAWQIDFKAIWDHDEEGKRKRSEAETIFGDHLAQRRFLLLPAARQDSKKILQDLFSGQDLRFIREALEIGQDTSFKRTIQVLFYSPKRAEILERLSNETKANFEEVYALIS